MFGLVRLSRNWYTKNAMDVGNTERPSVTFNSENMAKRSIIAADISTSMDILPVLLYTVLYTVLLYTK